MYGLSTEGVLYSWGLPKGKVAQGDFVCERKTVLDNGRAILDFSAGEGYLMVLGDIVRQIPYPQEVPS